MRINEYMYVCMYEYMYVSTSSKSCVRHLQVYAHSFRQADTEDLVESVSLRSNIQGHNQMCSFEGRLHSGEILL